MGDSSGDLVGQWMLGTIIGSGGNAVVWSAKHSVNGHRAALKIIRNQKVEKDPYQRFVEEVVFLRDLPDSSGILPLLDFNLPERPRGTDRAWLAMPLATPIMEAVSEQSLEIVVDAVKAIAKTLARLQRDYGIGHRDIKPNNLYKLDDDWVIGDFGLIAFPDKSGLTEPNRPMGPAHFAPWELTIDPANADPFAVDVYSLAKTLWVLATGVNFAPDGHQPSTMSGVLIGDYRHHQRSRELDILIDSATRLRPEERPSMEAFARELNAWENLPLSQERLDAEEFRQLLNLKIGPVLSERESLERNKALFMENVRQLDEATEPINQYLTDLYPYSKIRIFDDSLAQHYLTPTPTLGNPRPVETYQRCSKIDPFERIGAVTLRIGWGLRLFPDGMVELRLMVIVQPESLVNSLYWWVSEPTSAAVGSVSAEKIILDAIPQLTDHLREGISVFIENQPDHPS